MCGGGEAHGLRFVCEVESRGGLSGVLGCGACDEVESMKSWGVYSIGGRNDPKTGRSEMVFLSVKPPAFGIHDNTHRFIA